MGGGREIAVGVGLGGDVTRPLLIATHLSGRASGAIIHRPSIGFDGKKKCGNAAPESTHRLMADGICCRVSSGFRSDFRVGVGSDVTGSFHLGTRVCISPPSGALWEEEEEEEEGRGSQWGLGGVRRGVRRGASCLLILPNGACWVQSLSLMTCRCLPRLPSGGVPTRRRWRR